MKTKYHILVNYTSFNPTILYDDYTWRYSPNPSIWSNHFLLLESEEAGYNLARLLNLDPEKYKVIPIKFEVNLNDSLNKGE